jgi:phosphohistidine phosphatase
MEVYFLRHADAGAAAGGKGGDFERPLSPEGIDRMEREAVAISRLRPGVDAILTSPLVRARQTAEILAKELRMEKALIVDKRLAPGFAAKDLAAILAERRSSPGVVLVGHEPDFGRVISAFTGGSRIECKKGSLARVDVDDPSSAAGTLAWLLPPRVLAPNPPSTAPRPPRPPDTPA